MAILHCGNNRWVISKMDGFNVSMYGFWDYWKHNILIPTGLAKSDDCLPFCNSAPFILSPLLTPQIEDSKSYDNVSFDILMHLSYCN